MSFETARMTAAQLRAFLNDPANDDAEIIVQIKFKGKTVQKIEAAK